MNNKMLLNANAYCLITFPTTHSALHAEKLLEESGMPFLVVPTPREISAGCGLSIRCFCEDFDRITAKLTDTGINVDEGYEVKKVDGKITIEPLQVTSK